MVNLLLNAVNECEYLECDVPLEQVRTLIDKARKSTKSESESYLADLFVLDRYADFLGEFCATWRQVYEKQFSSSWRSLQDALTLLRLIKRFSGLDIDTFEDQLIHLEKAYPYNVFLSIGATANYCECSICGEDIDSLKCAHMRGELYLGVMAHAIVRKLTNMDHISFVLHPEDKRCVVSYDDNGEQFQLMRYISELLLDSELRALEFERLEFTKKTVPNPEYVEIGRNSLCFCGSGMKFKHCCITKAYIEGDHANVIPVRRSPEGFLP